ncbi:hypothetical protein HDR69_04845 [bacterium]|nr:hypothetical protein [bacterium]
MGFFNFSNNTKIISGYQVYKNCLIWKGMPDCETQLTIQQAKDIIKKSGAWMLRNIYNWDCEDTTNFWYIIKDNITFQYSKKTKKYIQKANDRFNYQIIDRVQFAKEGFRVYEAAFNHYKINDGFRADESQFADKVKKLGESIEIWGAIDKETGLLEAYALCNKIGDTIDFQESKANPAFLPKYYIMYGLYDARNKYYLGEKGYRFVVTSARSVTEHSNIQNFMIEKFGFRKCYCRMTLHYSKWFKLVVYTLYPFRNLISYAPLKNILKFEEINRQRDT